jgi:hypothetical protein
MQVGASTGLILFNVDHERTIPGQSQQFRFRRLPAATDTRTYGVGHWNDSTGGGASAEVN